MENSNTLLQKKLKIFYIHKHEITLGVSLKGQLLKPEHAFFEIIIIFFMYLN